MAKFQINGPNGEHFEVEAPDDATEEQVMQFVQQEAPKQQPKVGAVASAATGVGQGATFGFMDELAGLGLAAGAKIAGDKRPFSQLYDQGVAIPRAVQSAAADQHPYAYYGGQIAAGVAPAVVSGGAGAAPAVARAGLGARTAVGAAEGAAYGGLFGAGTAEGGIQDRAIGAGIGGSIGAVGGAVLPAAVDAGSALFRGLVSNPIKGVLAPERFGRQKVAEALMRDKNPENFVGRDAQASLNDLTRLRGETGKDLRLMDMGGENTRNLLRSAANMASTGAQRLNRTLDGPTRQGAQWARIERDMARGLGSPDDYAASIDHIVAARDQASKPLFDRAFATPIKPSEQLVSVLMRPGMQDILRRTAAKMENEGADVSGAPPMAMLHRAKMEIDKAISEVKTGQSNTANWDVRTLTKMKHDLLDAIDNPAYRDALRVSAGDNALKSAAQDGFDEALVIPTEDLARKMRSFANESERDMYRMGAARAIAGKSRRSNVTSDRTENVFSSPDMRLRLKAIFPDNRSLREFQRDLVLEARMADTRKAVQGGPTTAKQLMNAQEAGVPVAAVTSVANAAAGRFEPLLNVLARGANRFSGLTPSTANSVIDAAMTKGGGRVHEEITNALMDASKVPYKRASKVRVLNALSGASGPIYLDNQ